jgi:hypothetical protein
LFLSGVKLLPKNLGVAKFEPEHSRNDQIVKCCQTGFPKILTQPINFARHILQAGATQGWSPDPTEKLLFGSESGRDEPSGPSWVATRRQN